MFDTYNRIRVGDITTKRGRKAISAADTIVGVDIGNEVRATFFGQQKAEIPTFHPAVSPPFSTLIVSLDFGSDEPEQLAQRIQELRSECAYRPSDLFPKIVVEYDSIPAQFHSTITAAVQSIPKIHRKVLPKGECKMHYLARLYGYPAVIHQVGRIHNILQTAFLTNLGTLLYSFFRTDTDHTEFDYKFRSDQLHMALLIHDHVVSSLMEPQWCIDVVMGADASGSITFRGRALERIPSEFGFAYYSRRKPKLIYSDGKEGPIVAFSRHAMERICERTVLDWREYRGHGDAFGYLDNCIYFEDCSASFGSNCFAVYNHCGEYPFIGYRYLENLVRDPDPDATYSYRVGYCPFVREGEFAKAKTLLLPGMRGTPERKLIEQSKCPGVEKQRLYDAVEGQLTLKTLAESQDFSLIRWFHDNGLPQVIHLKSSIFAHG